MTETLADNNKMGAIFDADDRLKAAMERIKQLESLVEVMEVRNGGLMAEKNEAIKAAKRWQRRAEGN
jgi:Mor family transcriptional regulator